MGATLVIEGDGVVSNAKPGRQLKNENRGFWGVANGSISKLKSCWPLT